MSPAKVCPECQASLDDEAVLCIDCGYHWTLGRRLASPQPSLADPTILSGDSFRQPYALLPSLGSEEDLQLRLDEASARRARIIADGAPNIYVFLALLMCGFLLAPFMAPWYAYRWLCWRDMYRRYPQLRNPNSLSEFVDVEMRFRQAGVRYAIGIFMGICVALFVFWALQS
ncbi:MAG: hypothetical protein KDB22_08785 [Planctomycetales bacterium]|nr:hypothetical protein [Planctomycetales bacterium]